MSAPIPGPPPGDPVDAALEALTAVDQDDLDGILAAGDNLHVVLQRRLGELRGD